MFKTSTRSLGGVAIIDCYGEIVMGEETAFLFRRIRKKACIDRRQPLD